MPEEKAPRPFWSGTITFGLVNIPVSLFPAVRSRRVSLRMVAPDGTPLERRYYNPRKNRGLDWSDIVRGYEIEKDAFVALSDEELEGLAPEKTRDIDLRLFVPADDLDPMYFERGYYLVPAEGSTKAYRLLAATMEKTGRAGIATFVMRAKEYLVAITAENGILRAETLRFADEIRTPADIGLPEPGKPKAAQVTRMAKAIDALAKKELDEDELADRETERLLELAEAKRAAGADVVDAPEEDVVEAPTEGVLSLVEALQRSLEGGGNAGKRRRASRPAAGGALAERTKQELYERAKELDIAGRSGMSKDELIRAIRRSA